MALLYGATAPASAQEAGANYVQRLRLQAQLEALNADLLGQNSATAVLQARCERLGGDTPRLLARPLAVVDDLAAAAGARRQLGVGANAPIRHRRVELVCGETVLSRADNWYLPERLTQDMNSALDTTQTPFGVIVQPLGFQRRTLAARLLFSPLPYGWETKDPATLDVSVTVPANVLQHRALLQTPDGRPFALLIETYTAAVLVP